MMIICKDTNVNHISYIVNIITTNNLEILIVLIQIIKKKSLILRILQVSRIKVWINEDLYSCFNFPGFYCSHFVLWSRNSVGSSNWAGRSWVAGFWNQGMNIPGERPNFTDMLPHYSVPSPPYMYTRRSSSSLAAYTYYIGSMGQRGSRLQTFCIATDPCILARVDWVFFFRKMHNKIFLIYTWSLEPTCLKEGAHC